MRLYIDSSAILKRIFEEAESRAFADEVEGWLRDGGSLFASSLAWVEVSRALLTRGRAAGDEQLVEDAFDDVYEHYISPEVVSLARRVNPTQLRSLDAIHLASALLLDVDAIVTYDDRLAAACGGNNLTAAAPGR
ncbi:MAG: type II toxin-antitoxin system VapC family toxin [Candidatus Dormibacteraeota bacterium]|nr:type II toxin-antitoxin system VapC family toxin [Candidatus Dormibacteraeota bacterium]